MSSLASENYCEEVGDASTGGGRQSAGRNERRARKFFILVASRLRTVDKEGRMTFPNRKARRDHRKKEVLARNAFVAAERERLRQEWEVRDQARVARYMKELESQRAERVLDEAYRDRLRDYRNHDVLLAHNIAFVAGLTTRVVDASGSQPVLIETRDQPPSGSVLGTRMLTLAAGERSERDLRYEEKYRKFNDSRARGRKPTRRGRQ